MSANCFRVCTFNLLAEQYFSPSHYSFVDPELFDRSRRRDLILKAIDSLQSDILCLQEVDSYDDFLREALRSRGYESHFLKRTGRKKDGLCTAWRTSVFDGGEDDDITEVAFNDLADDANLLGVPQRSMESFRERYRRENVGLIVRLRQRHGPGSVLVANTHLYWNPRFPDVKIRQLLYFVRQVEKVLHSCPAPLVFAGDLNTTPGSAIHSLLLNGSVEDNELFQPKMLFEGSLQRTAKLFRHIGVDAAISLKSYDLVFEQARSEGRLLVTKSKQIVARADCPRHVLLPSDIDDKESFRMLFFLFRFQVSSERTFSRCALCNSGIVSISRPEALLLGAPPNLDLEDGFEFSKCSACSQCFWWGPKTDNKLSDIMHILEPELPSADTVHAHFPPSSAGLGVNQALLSHSLRLQSAFQKFYGQEPEFTNFTPDFVATLDYLCYSPDTLECVAVDALMTREEASIEMALPNSFWPSDHLALVAELRFRDAETPAPDTSDASAQSDS